MHRLQLANRANQFTIATDKLFGLINTGIIMHASFVSENGANISVAGK